MPEYIVKTFKNRNLVIEADHFEATNGALYSFFKEGILVASVPVHAVFAVVEEVAFREDFYSVDDLDEDDTDDVCKDCRFSEFLDSEEFFNTVYDAVEVILSDDEPKLVIEKWVNKGGDVQYGFQTPEGFVNFSDSLDSAETGLKIYLCGEKLWEYLDLTGYTKVED
jgi:hypothetical protein